MNDVDLQRNAAAFAPTRILFVIDSLKIGGAEMLLISFARRCIELGCEVDVAFFSPGPLQTELQDLGAATHRIGRNSRATPAALMALVACMRKVRPGIVHTHLRKSHLCGQLAARLCSVPVRVSTVHNADPWRRRRVLSWVDRTVTAGCQKRIAVSEIVRDYLVETGGYQRDSIVCVRNGVDTRLFDPARASGTQTRERWGVAADAPLIGLVGRLEQQKDPATFINAAAIAAAEHPDARFVLIGQGPLRDSLQQLVDDRNLQDRIVFAGVERDMPATFAALDIVAFSSLWEGLPVALLEAMAMGCAVVATDVGGIAGALGDAGVLVPANDSAALGNAISALLAQPRQAQSLGQRGRAIIEREYSLERMHRQTLAVYAALQQARPDVQPAAGL